jgi:hypothetical protein
MGNDAYRSRTRASPHAGLMGGNLVVPQGGRLPKVCLKCGSVKKLSTRIQHFEHAPPGLYFSLLLSPLAYLLLALITRRTGKAEISLCKRCDARWRDANTVRTLMPPASVVIVVAIATAVFNGALLVGAAIVLVSSAAFVWAHRRFVRGRTCDVQWIDKRGIALAGVHVEAAKAAVDPPATITE